jgi:hypothetical protein
MASAPDSQQRRAYVSVWIDGQPMDDSEERVLELRIDECTDGCSSLQMTLDLAPGGHGEWEPLDDGRFALLHRVTVTLSLAGGEDAAYTEARLFDGYITAVEACFGAARVPDSRLELSALDASGLMHLEEKTRNWGEVSDADIVKQLYQQYGFDADVDPATPVRDPRRGTMLQRGTDAELIRQLARRNGFEAYVEATAAPVVAGGAVGAGVVGHFHMPRVDQPAQPALVLMPRTSPSLNQLRARWESHRPTVIRGAHIDERTQRVRSSEVSAPRFNRLGTTSRADILAARLPAILPGQPELEAVALQHGCVPHDLAELEALAWSDFLEADWLVEGKGVVNGLAYPQILRARRPVELVGAGRLLDGKWYVRRCLHRWSWSGAERSYEVDVEMARNGLNGVA